MKNQLIVLILAAVFLLGLSPTRAAEDASATGEKKIVIALKADDFEVHETDISHLAVGEAETIVTDSGKTVDLLRTEEGVEVYVDGELMGSDLDGLGAHHGGHKVIHKHVEIICDDDEDCDGLVHLEEDIDFDAEVHDHDLEHDEAHGAKVIVIKRKAGETG